MSEAKHTPGPWEVNGLDVYRQGTTEWICESEHAGRSTDRLNADLNLIAAAPDLLKALEYIVNNCRVFCDDSMDIDGLATEDAVLAIRKAKGA